MEEYPRCVLYHHPVGEDSQSRFPMRMEGSAIDQFTLKRGKEALSHCVVIAIAHRSIEGRSQLHGNAFQIRYILIDSEYRDTSITVFIRALLP